MLPYQELIVRIGFLFAEGFPDDEKCIDDKSMKTVLGWREEELEAVMSEKSWVDSLLKMCMKITEYVRGAFMKSNPVLTALET